jgi:hypothetical protein
MQSGQPFIFRSEGVAWSASGTKNVPLDFLPVKSPRGNRYVISKLYVDCSLNVTTAGGETVTAYDAASAIARLTIKDSQGKRRDLTGTQLRVHALTELGQFAPPDEATFAAAQTAALSYLHVVPFERRKAARPHDYGIPCDDMHDGGSITISMPAADGGLLTNGGTALINSGTYTVYAECREEHDIQFHARDVVIDAQPASATDVQAPINGRLVRGILLVKEAEGTIVTGGTAVTTITDVSIDAYGMQMVPRAYLRADYITRGLPIDTGRDPVYNNRAQPLVLAPAGAKIPDMLLIQRNMLIRLTSTFTAPTLILDLIAPRSEEFIRRTLARFGLPQSAFDNAVIKTAKPSAKTSPAEWGPYRLFMPAKVG